MKSFPPTLKQNLDSNIQHLAAQDWEQREAKAAAIEAAELRQKSLQEAQELGPRFDLHRLPQNFWVAEITEPQEKLQFYSFAQQIADCSDLFRIGDHVLFFRSNLSEQEIRENIDLSFLPF